jgi:DnaJ-class molecular chaperone
MSLTVNETKREMEKECAVPVAKELHVRDHHVVKPKHYDYFGEQAIDVIKAALTAEEYIGFLKGNSLKYRLRAGKKNNALEDLKKAEEYEKMFDER